MKIVACLVGLLLGLAVALPAQAADPLQTRYLLFQIFTYPGLAGPVGPVGPVVRSIADTVGTTGRNGRKLGFVVGPLTFDHADADLVRIIDDSFLAASTDNVAVMFHIDDSMFWKNRPDLWGQHQNVEWTSWDGTESAPRTLPWYSAATLAPQMCYNSPAIQQAIARRVGAVIGPAIRRNLVRLHQRHQDDLFAGIIVGWETQLPDVDPAVGYCALTHLGYSAGNPPADMNAVLTGVVYQFIEFWDLQFIAAGIAPDHLFTHIAVSPPGADVDHAPVPIAFSQFNHGGFSVYGTEGQAYPQIYQVLAAQPGLRWGVSEGSNLYPPNALPGGSGRPDEPMADYLAQAYREGATYVNLFGWQSKGTPFRSVLVDPAAIKAYRAFLQPGPLPP